MFIYVYMQQSVLNKSLLKFPDQKVLSCLKLQYAYKTNSFQTKCSQKNPASTNTLKTLFL